MNLINYKSDQEERSIQKNTDSYVDWYKSILNDSHSEKITSLSLKELDKQFSKDLATLAKALSNTPVNKRTELADFISIVVSYYIEQKVEKELDNFFSKIMTVNE